MKTTLFTVYDTKAEAYLPPFNFNTIGQALRAFADMCNTPEHGFCRHPEDYTLFKLGTFDDQKALFDLETNPQPLGTAIEYKKIQELPLSMPLDNERYAEAPTNGR